jgi:hypothetical protein
MTLLRAIIALLLGMALSHCAAAGKNSREPEGYVRVQFAEHLKIAKDLQFTGTRQLQSLSFKLPARLKPRSGSSLHVFLQHSAHLDAERSFLSVSLNHGILRSVRLGEQSAQATQIVIPIPPHMFREENELAFFVEQSPVAGAHGGQAWTRISARSFLALRFTEAPPELNLARLPAPLLEPRPFGESALSVLLPEKYDASTFEATALVLANLSRRVAPERVRVRVVRSMALARQPLLIVGTRAEQPQLRSLLRASDAGSLDEGEGLVGLATGGQANANPVLFITGNSSDAVLRAARSVLSPHWHASGKVARVAKEPAVAPSMPREWPGFMPPRSLFTLADLGLKDLRITSQAGDALAVRLNATPDARFLNYGNRMLLKLRLNPEVYVGDARLLVQLNDVTVAEVTKENFRGSIASVPLMIPKNVLKPRNVLQIAWKGAPYSADGGAVAWLLPGSEFYLPRYYETELPDLGLLQFQLYPFSLKGDLSDVLVVLPDKLDEQALTALLELSAAFGQLAPAAHLTFRVRRMGDLAQPELSDSHLVVLNTQNHPDALAALLSTWNSRPFKGRPVMREMASPWNAQRYILVISAKPGQLHRAVSEGFSQSSIAQLRGDAAYLTARSPESFVIGPRVKTSEYSYFLFVEAWLRAHWLALPIILIAVSGLLFVGVRMALRHYGSRSATRPAT